jgi:ATP-binding cassette subfamily B (MDR/TAP) protein 1
MQPNVEAQAKELAKASTIVNSALSAIDVVKSFNGQNAENWQYAEAIRRAAKYYLVQAQANALQIGFIRFVTLGIFVSGFWFGSHLVNTGSKNSGDVLACFWACLIAMQTADQLSPQFLYLEKGRAAGATLTANIIQMERGRKITNMIGKISPENCGGDVQVHNVSLSGA